MKKIIIFLLLSIPFIGITAQTPAFPGAEGHGRYTTGGRGGIVYYVDTLEDDETLGSAINRAGSLRWCLARNTAGKPITILFKVSGTIQLNKGLGINRDDVTIAGQSAPGDGICIGGFPVSVQGNNIILRFLRFRMGDLKDTNSDGADGLGGRYMKNIMIDHCSVSWCTDECISFYNNTNITVQWCIGSESLTNSKHSKGAHGYGAIWGGFGASFHHNLLAHHDSRMPRLGPGVNTTKTNELVDIRNNVFYNYNGQGSYGGECMHVNMVNNYFKPGPAFAKNYDRRGRILSTGKNMDNPASEIYNTWGTFFIEGNYIDGHPQATANNWDYGVYNQFHSSLGTVSEEDKRALKLLTPLDTVYVTTHTAENAYEKVLLYAGASLHRDIIDVRLAEETRTNAAQFIGKSPNNTNPRPGIIDSQQDLMPDGADDSWSAWPTLQQGEVPVDADKDGIPDNWLEAHYPGKKATDLNEEGYTYLEVYLNSLVEDITQKQNENAITGIEADKVLNEDSSLNVFYDKSSREINIRTQKEMSSVLIYNLTGILVSSLNCENQTEVMYNVDDFRSNFYVVKVTLKDRSVLAGKVFTN